METDPLEYFTCWQNRYGDCD